MAVAPGSRSPPWADVDARLEDYLDDKLQAASDLDDENLDSLLASVELQRGQLQSQLDDASRELEAARRAAADSQAALARRVADFQTLQASIDARLAVVKASDAPDDAIRRLRAPADRLHRVDLAGKYLALLRRVYDLRDQARGFLPESPRSALEPYTHLKGLAVRLREVNEAEADQAAVHLVRHVDRVTSALWDEMKATMRGELEAVLQRRNWPAGVDPRGPDPVDSEWLRCFERLVDLQVPEVLVAPPGTVLSLLPMDVMAHIFVKEFRFHFLSSDKAKAATSSPQAIGVHCFPWLLALLERWEDFFRDNFGPALAARFCGTPAAGRVVYMDPACALITSMLPVVREKIESVMPVAVQDPAFLSSLMGQLMTLDESIRDGYDYDGVAFPGADRADLEGRSWGGLTAEVLSNAAYFDAWLRAEKEFALERYRTIMEPKEARAIDYDFLGPGKTKPTQAAVRVTDLLRSVTAQYERVPQFSYRLRFLIDIQLAILDEYHDHLRGILGAYATMTSTVGRAAFGVTKEQQAALEGTGTFEWLCQVYGSADHVVNTLLDWGNEEFFVTLWDQLQARAKAAEDKGNVAGDLSYEHVKDRTSSTVGTEDDGGVLFDETIAAYRERRKRAQELLSAAIIESQRKAFKAYLQRPRWTTLGEDTADASQLAVTLELDEPLRVLKRDLDFLSQALGSAVLRRVWRDALEALNGMLWSDVLMGQRFTAFGAAQFARDLHAIEALVERYVPGGAASALGSLADAVRLLGLPVEGDGGDDGAGGGGNEAATGGKGGGGEEEEEEEEEGEKEENMAPRLSLRTASDMAFTSNAEAKRMLDLLGMGSLTPTHARQILQRRVEAAD